MSGVREGAGELERVTREREAFARALETSNEAFIQKVKELSIVKRISAELGDVLDWRRVCSGIVDLIIDETIAESCSLWLPDRDHAWLELVAVRGQTNPAPKFFPAGRRGHRLQIGEGAAGTVAREGKPLLIDDVAASPHFIDYGSDREIKSLLCLPIPGKDRPIGVLNMSHPDSDAFSLEDQRLLTLITEQVAVAFTNLRLFEEISLLNRDLEAKVAERTQNLARSEERFQRAVNAAKVGIWDWRIGDRQLYIAANLFEMLGHDRGDRDSSLRTCLRRIHPDDRRALFGGVRFCFGSSGSVYENELRLRHRDGRFHWFFVRFALVHEEQDGHWLAGSLTDITRRKIAEQEIVTLQKEALVNAHAAGKAEFATTVLHNIGNVLNSVNVDSAEIRRGVRDMRLDRLEMTLDLIAQNQDDLAGFFASDKGQQLRTYLSRIIEAIDRASHGVIVHTEEIHNKIEIARDIIETQQSYAKGNELKKQNLVQLVDEALKIQHESIRKRGILLEKKYAAVRPIQVPSAKIIHLLINLVKNAVEALAQAPPENRVLSVELGELEDAVFIRIEDNGIGISPENLPKMFTHGFTTKQHGHGFGLRYCAKTARDLGGDISVSSNGVGKGARFTITIPYARVENTSLRQEQDQSAPV